MMRLEKDEGETEGERDNEMRMAKETLEKYNFDLATVESTTAERVPMSRESRPSVHSVDGRGRATPVIRSQSYIWGRGGGEAFTQVFYI